MQVCVHEGRSHALSNRRLAVLRVLSLLGPAWDEKLFTVEVVDKPASFGWKYTTRDEGRSLVVRGRRRGEFIGVVSDSIQDTTFPFPPLQLIRSRFFQREGAEQLPGFGTFPRRGEG